MREERKKEAINTVQTDIEKEHFVLSSNGLRLRVFLARPQASTRPLPSVQIHHAGGGYEPIYEEMAVQLAEKNYVGVTMIHRGYPGSDGEMEYGKGEIVDIGNLTRELLSRPYIDPRRMGIMGYSRGALNALLSIERYDFFRAGVLWSTPVDIADHVEVNPWIAETIGGFPEDVPEEYRIRSPLLAVDKVSCPLLLIHGEMDYVVPVRHTLRLARALNKYDKSYEMKVFEGEEHIWSPFGFGRNWLLSIQFFERHLQQRESRQ